MKSLKQFISEATKPKDWDKAVKEVTKAMDKTGVNYALKRDIQYRELLVLVPNDKQRGNRKVEDAVFDADDKYKEFEVSLGGSAGGGGIVNI